LLAVGVLPGLALPGIGLDPAVNRNWLAVACAAAAVIGHVYPVWHEFRGGKGAATLIGTVAVLAPAALLPVFAVWLACVMLTGYVGLATMLATLALPVWVAIVQPGNTALLLFGVAMAAFIAYTHRSNIARMRAGNENRARRLWLLRPR
jgi:glycerol-3-phosphate acyltransferase PlsY